MQSAKPVHLVESRLSGSRQYKAYTLANFRQLPQIEKLPQEQQFAMEVVGRVLPFRTNNHVVETLIDWSHLEQDPMFVLTFPQRDMLRPEHFAEMATLVGSGAGKREINETADRIRMELNPHSAGQLEHNVPVFEEQSIRGMQHKYRETVLFFPSEGQTCHAYCSFCFRWPQFIGMKDVKFAMRDVGLLTEYLRKHPDVTDVLFTGGDPMIMRTRNLAVYIEALLEARLPNLRNIRIGSKAISYWPYRFVTDEDADDLMRLFEKVTAAGKHLAIMAHFNHPMEMAPSITKRAIQRIRNTGAQIRTQSPILRHINDKPAVWANMWREQVRLGMIPYYMFVVRDTGAQHYFGVPLVEAWTIYQKAIQQVGGLARTVRGPSMSADPGKVHVLGPTEVLGEKVLALQVIQGRNPDWVGRPFFARYDEEAIWLDELEPAFGREKFFYHDELASMYGDESSNYDDEKPMAA